VFRTFGLPDSLPADYEPRGAQPVPV
jgi:hypothetical protein